MATLEERLDQAANKLAKWRNVYASWRLGTTGPNDPEVRYTKDLHEQLLMIRAENSALTHLVAELVGHEKLMETFIREYQALDRLQESKFPGFSTSLAGIHVEARTAAVTMKKKGFRQ